MPQLKREIVSGGRFGPARGQFITRFQEHGWRTDSRVRISHAQPRSPSPTREELLQRLRSGEITILDVRPQDGELCGKLGDDGMR